MGQDSPQLTLTAIESWSGKPFLPPDSIYAQLANWGESLLPEEVFAELYAAGGRPSVPPLRLAKALLLMFHEGVSDREAEERARFDLRWKIALGVGIDEAGFDHTALCRFRARLLQQGKERVAFDRFVQAAMASGLVKAKDATAIIDSTPVLGAGAVQDSYQLLRSAIRKLLRRLAKKPSYRGRLVQLLQRSDYEQPGKPEIDWKNPESRQKLLGELVADAQSLLRLTEGAELNAATAADRSMLAAIVVQDVVIDEAGQAHLRQGVTPGRVISTSDPEMRYGHKTNQRLFAGYKADVVEDADSGIVTNVGVIAGNGADGPMAPKLLDQQMRAVGIQPAELFGDTAYGTMAVREQLGACGVTVWAPLGESHAPVYSKWEFTWDLQQGTCTCPAGQLAHGWQTAHATWRFAFSKRTCAECALRPACTTSKSRGRCLEVSASDELARTVREFNRTQTFRRRYRRRALIERCMAELVRHGGRKARYRGTLKIQLQWLWVAAAVNLRRIAKLLSAQGRQPAASATA